MVVKVVEVDQVSFQILLIILILVLKSMMELSSINELIVVK